MQRFGGSCRQANDAAGFIERRDRGSEVLDHAARLGDHFRIGCRKTSAGEINGVFEANPDVTSGKLGLRHAGERGLSNANGRELRIVGQQVSRVEHGLGGRLKAVAHAHDKRAQHRPLQRAVSEEIAH